jgi:group II intron reverse transcriptase/maturase
MRNAETILGIIRERGRRGLPLEDVYRQMFNPQLYLLAYGRIYRNKGVMTPSVTAETVDGMSLAKIERVIEQLRYERFRWHPTRRVYILKKNGKQRPLGMPTWTDKLVQEVIRLILDAYYDPQFSTHSHGFRPERGCHTALQEITRTWRGTTWFIEGDISRCFDKLDHSVLIQTLGERIHDNRFLRLINGALKAGYLEEWRYNKTLSGTPQGGVVSPILSNIYLDRLDKFVETTLLPAHNRGAKRQRSKEYHRHSCNYLNAVKRGDLARAKELRRKMQSIPRGETHDPNYRRLRYIRYADDFLLGFAGPREEAEEIKRQIGMFLRDTLKLELSEAKTLITHARSEEAHFLGYEVVVHQNDQRHSEGERTINGTVGLKVPEAVIKSKCARYMKNGKPIHRVELVNNEVYSIIVQYQLEYRGVINYYQMAYNLHRLNQLKWVMETSLTKTLAHKLRTTVRKVYRRYGTQIETEYGSMKGLEETVEREGREPLVAKWGGIPLRWKKETVLNDQPIPVINGSRTEIVERLLADTCELCGSHEDCEVHHIRALKNLKMKGRKEKPQWIIAMAARHRKTLVVCKSCHNDIHAGDLARKRKTRTILTRTAGTGEPDDAKVSRPVRRGADGKVPLNYHSAL